MATTATDHVYRDESLSTPLAGRRGTLRRAESDLIAAFGEPVDPGYSDGKVTKSWRFSTPRGAVDIRDYWWNGHGEWSLSSVDSKAIIWLRQFVKASIPGAQFQFRKRHFA